MHAYKPECISQQKNNVPAGVTRSINALYCKVYLLGGTEIIVPQVIQYLPEGLAREVLDAARFDLERQLSMLPASLHPLAIEAAFPFIRLHNSLDLDFSSPMRISSTTACEVLHFATTGNTALRYLTLQDIPMRRNRRLFRLIAAACISAAAVSLSFSCADMQHLREWQPAVQLGRALSSNASLTSLHLTVFDDPHHDFNYACLLEGLTGLQSLSVALNFRHQNGRCLPECAVPRCILLFFHLTRLCLGPGFHLMDVPHIVGHLPWLQELHLEGSFDVPMLPPLSFMHLQTLKLGNFPMLKTMPTLSLSTSLQTLKVTGCSQLLEVPPLDTLTALHTLEICSCGQLKQLPPLTGLKALQTINLEGCPQLLEMPVLDNLTSLQDIDLCECIEVQQLPPLNSLKALRTLGVEDNERLLGLPPLNDLTALQVLNLHACAQLKQLPSLDSLKALQTLFLDSCCQLQQLPSLDSLEALLTLNVSNCEQVKHLPPLDSLSALQTLDLSYCSKVEELPPLDSLTALKTLILSCCRGLLELPLLRSLTALQTFVLSFCQQLQQLPPLDRLAALQTLDLSDCEQLQKLPSMDRLTALRELHLWNCQKLSKGCLKLPSRQGPGVQVWGISEKTLRELQGERGERGSHDRFSRGYAMPLR
jgi:Leucine-rich repeat (LRR) protein